MLVCFLTATLCFNLLQASSALAHPQHGDVFRDYVWVPPTGDAGGSLRVGGRLDYGGQPIALMHEFDLAHATKAEVVIEKLLCHDGTRGLSIQINGNDWIEVPEAAKIPPPQADYQHFIYPVITVPLAQFKTGAGNSFALRVSAEHPWNWPQNLIYGARFRIYYDAAQKPHPTGRITAPLPGGKLGPRTELAADVANSSNKAARVAFLGLYEDINWEGDGEYRQWHYHFFRGQLVGHLGDATAAPFRASWDTAWLPDQQQPIEVAAWISDDTNLTFFTQPVGGLILNRPGVSVELCKPYDVPKKWVTRAGEKQEKFRVAGDLRRATAAQLVWTSWSPGYMNGVFINDRKVFDAEGPRYACYEHRVPLTDLSVLAPGENRLKTGLTPKYDGKTVHGMEVNWPGIMLLIRYKQRPAP